MPKTQTNQKKRPRSTTYPYHRHYHKKESFGPDGNPTRFTGNEVQRLIKLDKTPISGPELHYAAEISEKTLAQIKNANEKNTRGLKRLSRKSVCPTLLTKTDSATPVHPDKRRLTLHELARFQGFPDNYQFCGTFKGIRQQIGNAVIPFISYLLAKELRTHFGLPAYFQDPNNNQEQSMDIIDLFCGAGGFGLGFVQDGHSIALATDIDSECLETYKINHTKFADKATKLDILDPKDFKTLQNKCLAAKNEAEESQRPLVFIGGSPCQENSLANSNREAYMLENKPLEQYLKLAFEVKPDCFVIENVAGLQQGKKEDYFLGIIKTIEQNNYKVTMRLLYGAHYGIPQSRPRIFLVATKDKKFNDFLPALTFHPVPPKEKSLFNIPTQGDSSALEILKEEKTIPRSQRMLRGLLPSEKLPSRKTQQIVFCQNAISDQVPPFDLPLKQDLRPLQALYKVPNEQIINEQNQNNEEARTSGCAQQLQKVSIPGFAQLSRGLIAPQDYLAALELLNIRHTLPKPDIDLTDVEK